MTVKNEFFTLAVHGGSELEPTTGAVTPPIFLSSTFAQKAPGEHQGFDYSRAGNPTRDAYEKGLALLEGADHGLAFASGLAAEQAIVQTVKPGGQVLVCDDVYGGTGRLFRNLFAQYGIDFQFIDMTDVESVRAATSHKTAMIWVETPTNPTIKIIDIRAMSAIAQSVGAMLVVDNTFASPIFQQPLALGAHVVVHSTTKYIGGHADTVGGAIMLNDPVLAERLRFIQFAAGAVPSPFDCYMLHRSLKTLAIRMQKHESNAKAVSEFLADHKKVAKVFYPGLPNHPNRELAQEQMQGYSGMISFEHAGSYGQVVEFLQKLKIFCLAESLGGVESLVNHPEKMTHASVPENLRRKLGIGPNLVRLSVGIENAQDLIGDLAQALG